MKSPVQVVNHLFDAWNAKDISAMALCLDVNVTLDGPLESFVGRQRYLEGAEKVFGNFRAFRVVKQLADDESVMTLLDIVMLVPGGEHIQRCIEHSEVRDGVVISTVAYYDATVLKQFFTVGADGVPQRQGSADTGV